MQPGLLGAISPYEQRGLLEPYEHPEPSPFAGLLGPPLRDRMAQASQDQRARWDAGQRSPTPLTEDNMWLADDVAGGFLGPVGAMGATRKMPSFTAERSPAGYQTVMTDVDKLDSAWRSSPDWVGEGAEIGNRRAQFREWLQKNPEAEVRTSQVGGLQPQLVRDASGNPIQRADGTYEIVQVPVFVDGRHRLSVFRDDGVSEVPISVSEKIAEEFTRLFGAAGR